MTIFRTSASALLALACAGCMSYNVEPIGTFDSTQKTMTVAPGGASLAGIIKLKLRRDGWQLAVDRGPDVEETEIGPNSSRTEKFNSFNTRYRMGVSARFEDIAIGGGSIYHYDISIIDNKTGSEVLTMVGRGIDGTIADELVKAIREHSK